MTVFQLTWIEGFDSDRDLCSTYALAFKAAKDIINLFKEKYKGYSVEEDISKDYLTCLAKSGSEFYHISVHIQEKEINPSISTYEKRRQTTNQRHW